MSTTNAYCEALGIQVPRLEAARTNPDANYYSLLIVALLERGDPITLAEAAMRFEEAGVAPARSARIAQAVQAGKASDLPQREPLRARPT